MKIDWKTLWNDFEEWIITEESRPYKLCEHCGHKEYPPYPSWERQVKKIQSLVKKQLRIK